MRCSVVRCSAMCFNVLPFASSELSKKVVILRLCMPCHVSELTMLQPVPKKMRPKMVVGIEIEILDCQRSGCFSNEPFEKRPAMTIRDFDFRSGDYFKLRQVFRERAVVCADFLDGQDPENSKATLVWQPWKSAQGVCLRVSVNRGKSSWGCSQKEARQCVHR